MHASEPLSDASRRRPVRGCRSARVGLALLVVLLGGIAGTAPSRAGGIAFERARYAPYPALEGRTIRQVLILGNNHTEPVVFRREMLTQEGNPFSSEDLWRDWERLLDLGIFAELEVDAVPSGDGVLVVVSVYERPRVLLAPVADYDLDDKRVTLGYRLRLRNYDGLNRSFRSKGVAGRRDRLTMSWESPWLGSHRQSLALDLRIELPQADEADLRTSRFGIASTRYLGEYRRVRKGVTTFGRIEKLDRDGTHPNGAVDEVSPVIGLSLFRDTRNVRIDPARGTLASAGTELTSAWTTNDISYLRSALDARVFRTVFGRTVLAARGFTILSFGEIPDYRFLGVGGGGSIRGQPSDVEVGKNLGRASIEWRFPLLGQRRFVLPIPLVPRKISNVDLRIDGEVFVDAGSAWDDSVGFRSARVRGGAGFGLRIFLPVLELARFELAFDESGSPTLYFREGNII